MDRKTGGDPPWTPREREVLDRISRGLTNFEIAQDLGISLDGAKWHVSQILSKLGVKELAVVELTPEASDIEVTFAGGLRILPVETPLPPDGEKFR